MSTNRKLTGEPGWFDRSLRGAFLLSAIGVGNALISLNIFSWALGAVMLGSAQPPMVAEGSGDLLHLIALLGIMLLALLVPVLIGAILLYRLGGPRHFGKQAAIRWLIWGDIFGCLAAGLGILARSQELAPEVETLAYGGLLVISYCLAFVWTMPRD